MGACSRVHAGRSRKLLKLVAEVFTRPFYADEGVALYHCYNDTLFPETGQAVVKVLERLGHTVDFPKAQTCCVQMHVNSGYGREVVPLVRNFVTAFRDAEVIVSPSPSCVAMIHDYYPKLAALSGDAGLEREVAELLPRVREFAMFLVDELGVRDVGAYYPHRVTFHPTCHSLRLLRIGDAPLALLEHVRGLELVPLPQADECCGFGGTFAVKNAETSAAMLSDKLRCMQSTRAEVCAAADNSCLIHLGGALHRGRTGVRTVHLAEILASTEGSARGAS